MRNLAVLILLFVALWWGQRLLARFRALKHARQRPEVAVPELMRECGYCGVNVPDSEAVAEGTRFYCCDSHRRADGRGG